MKDCFQLSRFIKLEDYKPKNKKIMPSELIGKSFIIKKCTRYAKGKYGRPFYKLNIELNGQHYFFTTSSSLIVLELDDLTKQFSQLDELNVYVKLINVFGNYKLVDGEET